MIALGFNAAVRSVSYIIYCIVNVIRLEKKRRRIQSMKFLQHFHPSHKLTENLISTVYESQMSLDLEMLKPRNAQPQ